MVDTAGFEQQRRGANSAFARRAAENNYNRSLSRSRSNRGIQSRRRAFGQSTPKLRAQLGQRGLSGPGVRSGVASNALARHAANFQRDQGYALQDQAANDRQFVLQGASLEQERANRLAELQAEEQRQIALAALNIKAVRPLIGG